MLPQSMRGKTLPVFSMISRRHKSRLYRFLHKLGKSPLEVLESLQFLILGWVLFDTLAGFGGFLAYGEPMIGVSTGVFLLAAMHALVIAFREERFGIDWEVLLPLPLILYAYLHYHFLSPAPWEAAPFLVAGVQAYVIYMVVLNSVRGSRTAVWALAVCQTVAVIAMLTAFFQFYQFPDWMVTLERERNPAYLYGAAGLLLDPVNLAALLMIFLPASAFIVALRRYSGPIRMFNGFLVFAIAITIFLSTHLPGLFVLVAVILLLPLWVTGYSAFRKKLYTRGALVFLVMIPLFWFATDALRLRLLWFFETTTSPLERASQSIAWERFLESPLFGMGLGGYAFQWERIRPEGLEGTSLYPASAYLDLLSELGLVGLLCLLVPLLVLLVRGFKTWRKLPFLNVNKDTRDQMNRFPRGHPSRQRLERRRGKAPSGKIFLGSIILGVAALMVHVGWDHSLRLPIIQFTLAVLLAVLAVYARRRPRKRVQGLYGLVTGLIPLLLATWAITFGVPRFYAQYLVYTTNEELAYLLEDPDRIFIDPGVLSPVLAKFQGATRLDPGHGGAWIGEGRTSIGRLYADLWPMDELAGEAVPALEEALKVAPKSWLAHFEMARARAILGEGEVARAHLGEAIKLAPFRPEPAALLGSLLLLENPDSEEGRDLINRSLELAPGYEAARNTLRRLDLSGQTARGQGERLTQSIFTMSLLAQQFDLIESGPERVLGAGIMPEPEEVIPTPDEDS